MKKLIIIIYLLLLVGCSLKDKEITEEEIEKTFADTLDIKEYASISKYTIYGKYFNINGQLETDANNLVLILKKEDLEVEYPLIIEKKDNTILFKTNNLINEGINLDKIIVGNYYILLKDENNNYYSLKNDTKYEELEYYTITKEKKNNKINISFINFLDKKYLYLNVQEDKLPNNIYDIVIDAGHGGVDTGASSRGYYESKINLEYALLLKEKLESLGYKIKLTREKDESINNYGKNGRVSIPYLTKAKLMLSIHLNSANGIKNGGVEIYVANESDISFAKSIAKNIVDLTSSNYSPNNSDKVDKGVYLRTLTKSDLKTMEDEAKRDGYTPYEKANTNSTYYYIIRETGGIITGAYIDLRNPKKDGNPYYNSNHGCESYLLELGYINSSSNLNILLKEKDKYVDAITKSVDEYLKE